VSAFDPSQLPGKDGTPATHASGPDQSAIYAFRTSDGKQLWRRPTGGAPGPFRIGAGGVLYVGNDSGVLVALRASDGSVIWHISLDTLLDIKGEVNGVLYVSTVKTPGPGKLLALNASDGSTKWSFPIQGYLTNANVLGDVIAVVDTSTAVGKDGVPDTSHWLTVLNASDGSVKWKYQGDPATVGNAVAGQNTFYVTLMSGTGKEQTAVTLQALNMSDGSLRWQKSYTNFSLLSELGNGKAYVTVNNDTIVALNEQDGSVAWQAQPGPLYIDELLGGGLVNDTLYAQVGTTLYAFNADSGAVRWKASVGEGGMISGTSNQVIYELVKPTSPQETWYLRLIAIDAATGKTQWHKDLAPSSFGSILAV
jgi:outer membrane protein assembly factor BamB